MDSEDKPRGMALFGQPQPEMGTEGNVIWRRAIAVIIDIILLAIITSIISSLLAQARLAALGALFGLLISFAYYIYFEGNYGQTIGKKALSIVVVSEAGDPLDYRAATIRTILRIIDALPVLYLVGIIIVLVTDRNQRLGDLVAETVVVRATETGRN